MSNSQGTLKTDFEENYLPIFAPKISNEAIWTGLRHWMNILLK